MVPKEFEKLEAEGHFVVGVREDIDSIELFESQISSWLKQRIKRKLIKEEKAEKESTS